LRLRADLESDFSKRGRDGVQTRPGPLLLGSFGREHSLATIGLGGRGFQKRGPRRTLSGWIPAQPRLRRPPDLRHGATDDPGRRPEQP